jgi:antitoxin component YwqK of YwqJK toxin-antitoxin module
MKEKLILTFDTSGSLNMYKNIKQNDIYNQLLFFPSGNLSQKISIKKGQLEGTCITFYENGNIETLRYLKSGKDTLDGIDYYDEPFMRAKAAVYFNDSGHLQYKEYFDLNGKLIKKEGNP